MLNKIILLGRLTKEPEYKMTQTGTAVTNFTLAVERDYATDGVRQADFINCVSFKNTAEFINKHFVKGQLMCVLGTLQTRTWESQDGRKNYVTEVIVNEVHFTGDKRNGENHPAPQESEFIHVSDDNIPF